MRKRWRRAVALIVAVVALRGVAAEPRPAALPEGEAALRAHAELLAGPALRGRGAWEDRAKAAAYVARQLELAGLRPLPGRASFLVDHGGTPEQPEVRNVCGWWPEPPQTAAEVGEYVLLSAHYDHLGVKDGVVHPGADDNASGVAVLLEAVRGFVAREALVLREKGLARSLCVVAFDLEEQQLVGSRRFVAEPPVPLTKCALFLTLDQMGRSLADLDPGLLFLMGSEHCPWLERVVQDLAPPSGVRHAVLGIDFQPPTGYSDYVPFQEQRIPFLFVSTGACADYHRPQDTPDKLDYRRMALHVETMRTLLASALGAQAPLTWREEVEPRLAEIQEILRLVNLALPKVVEGGAPDAIQAMVVNFRGYLEKIVARGAVTAAERASVRNTARMLFVQAVRLLGQAQAAPR